VKELASNPDLVDATFWHVLCCWAWVILGCVSIVHLIVHLACVMFDRSLPKVVIYFTRPVLILSIWVFFLFSCYIAFGEATNLCYYRAAKLIKNTCIVLMWTIIPFYLMVLFAISFCQDGFLALMSNWSS
jgi:hypothetical protein